MATVKVNRVALIKALKAEQEKLAKQFKAEMAAFRRDEQTFPERLVKGLEALTKQVQAGRAKFSYSGAVSMDSLPKKPAKPGSTKTSMCMLERQIKTLSLSDQETISMNENSEYIRFMCRV